MRAGSPALVALTQAATAPDGLPKIIGVDGRSGAGKSTLAGWLAAETGATLLGIENTYPGWDGLEEGVRLIVRDVLEPLAAGLREVQVPLWDWTHNRPGEPRELVVGDALILEGVGAASKIVRPYLAASVWIEMPERERRKRAFKRDGDTYRPHWDRWAAQEERMLKRERTPERVDLVIGG